MELTSVRCLITSISRFVNLAICCTSKLPSKKDFRNLSTCLKNLKPLLDLIVDEKILSDESFSRECEKLDLALTQASKFLGKWSLTMSKILCVLQSEQFVVKIKGFALKISLLLLKLVELSPSNLSLPDAQSCMNELQNLKLNTIPELIEEALEIQRQGKIPQPEHLKAIMESLTLSSKHELLDECIGLEKERIEAEDLNLIADLDKINHIINLVSHIRDYMAKIESVSTINGIQIPPHFYCPLSLELMIEPVIIASGQTFERASIQKWIDSGLVVCPKTRQKLSHTSLINNHTVKALLASWSEENKIKFPETSESRSSFSVLSQAEDSGHADRNQCSFRSTKSTSRSSDEVGNNSEKIKISSSGCDAEELNVHSFSHSRSESASSAVSSVEYIPPISTDVSSLLRKCNNASDFSADITSNSRTSSFNTDSEYSHAFSAKQYHSSKVLGEVSGKGKLSLSRDLSLQISSGSKDLTTTTHVQKLVADLKSQSTELQTSAAEELRFLAKHNMENRVIIGHCGAIAPLISLLHSDIKITQEHTVTALLNLSISGNIKVMIADEGALEPLIHVLRTGNAGAKENAAATLFSISLLEEYRIKIGRSGAVKALIDLLGTGTIRGKKDAATALFNLSIFHENKARIVQAGAVKYLIELMDPEKEMVDKAVALLANLSTIPEGCTAIARGGGIPGLVEIVETGSLRGKENAASTILQLCVNSTKYCRLVLQEGAVPPLVALSQTGTPRAKEKAQQLLSHFRNQRESSTGRGKS